MGVFLLQLCQLGIDPVESKGRSGLNLFSEAEFSQISGDAQPTAVGIADNMLFFFFGYANLNSVGSMSQKMSPPSL